MKTKMQQFCLLINISDNRFYLSSPIIQQNSIRKALKELLSLASTSNYSNSNHTLFGLSAIGLNKNNFGRDRLIKDRNTSRPMLVTETKPAVMYY